MKRERLNLSQYQSIETGRDASGRFFVAYSNGASVFIRDLKDLRRFLKVPKSIQMRERLDAWLAELEEVDTKKTTLGVVEDLPGDSWDPKAHKMVV
jgi:hypothetical protein